MVCLVLWKVIAEVAKCEVGASSAARLGIFMQWLDLRLLAVAHHIYHYSKLSISTPASSVHAYKHWYNLRRRFLLVAKVAVADHMI